MRRRARWLGPVLVAVALAGDTNPDYSILGSVSDTSRFAMGRWPLADPQFVPWPPSVIYMIDPT